MSTVSAHARVLALGAVWVTVTGALLALSACYTHNCEPSLVQFGRNPGEGEMLDPDTWESSPVDGRWLDFPRQRTYIFDLQGLGNRAPQLILPYVSAHADPFHEFDNFTIGAGNIAEISGATNGAVTVHNDTCADYFLRLVVVTEPAPPDPNDPDAAAPAADSGSPDADAGDAGP